MSYIYEQREALRSALASAKEKLKLYRAAHSGEYIGGMEYVMLMQKIDAALTDKPFLET